MQTNPDEFLWVQKYRPKTIDDVILPDSVKQNFKELLDKQQVPNLILSGPAGTGKTTIALALLQEINADVMMINGSMYGNIDTLRVDIKQFASTVSFSGGRKYVILDEADYLNPTSTQPSLRNFMEEFSKNCGFILTCNFPNRIIDPIHSRCTTIDFSISNSDKKQLAGDFFKRVMGILDAEEIEYDKKAVASIIQKYFPDFRRTINELQRYSSSGKIDAGILVGVKDAELDALVKSMKEKDLNGIMAWVQNNKDIEANIVFRKLYDNLKKYLKPASLPMAILLIGKYQFQAASVADQEINLTAFLIEVTGDCEFK